MIKIKICGLTNSEDANMSDTLGADYLGFIFVPRSKRYLPNHNRQWIKDLQSNKKKVGVFENESPDVINKITSECSLDLVQLHGNYNSNDISKIHSRVWKVISIEDAVLNNFIEHNKIEFYLIDTVINQQSGGTGIPFNWELLNNLTLPKPIIVAGGITPDNISELLDKPTIYGIDVSSGVEKEVGRKDEQLLEKLFKNIKQHSVAN